MLDMFKAFLDDPAAEDMYVTGPAGTGKTTDLSKSVSYCMKNEIPYIVCAFTHKACNILRSKLPDGAYVTTLHSYLKKRPGVNQDATHINHVQSTSRFGGPENVAVLFIDEYSMVGEKDLMDIRAAQDQENAELKVVWIGDPNQLPPVGDQQAIKPKGKYSLTLTKIYRQAADNPLMAPLQQLVSFIGGAEPEPLIESEKFIRNQDIVEWYDKDRMADDFDGIMLAFTNEKVQELNAAAQGYSEPKAGDTLFCPNNRQTYTFVRQVPREEVAFIEQPFSGDFLAFDSKYKTLEYLVKDPSNLFCELLDEEGVPTVLLYKFGHYNFKLANEAYMEDAAASNAEIEKQYDCKASVWSAQNRGQPLARKRAKAWRDYLGFKDYCACLDFAHAMTVHKSQGSTYDSVYLDTQDLGIVSNTNYKLYLKLLYVAISRASNKVVTN